MIGPWFGHITDTELKAARDTVNQEGKDHYTVRTAATIKTELLKATETFGKASAFDIIVHALNDIGLINGTGRGISKTPPVSPKADP